jgi:hypothetical protein
VLKQYLRECEPLLTFALYDKFVAAVGEGMR